MHLFRLMQIALVFSTATAASGVLAQTQPQPKFSARVPSSILTPDTVQTRIGTLKFFDGLPDADTATKVYDNLDFSRGVEAFLAGMPAASVYAVCEGMSSAGAARNGGIAITEDLMDARSLFLTANSTAVYVIMCLDLKDGPVVAEVPPNVLGPIDDAYFRFVSDVGVTGPDRGKGGKYLVVPPDYQGELPKAGYFVAKSPTYGNVLFYRAFVQNGDVAAAVKNVKATARVYPLSAADNPPRSSLSTYPGCSSIPSTPTISSSMKSSIPSFRPSPTTGSSRKRSDCSRRSASRRASRSYLTHG